MVRVATGLVGLALGLTAITGCGGTTDAAAPAASPSATAAATAAARGLSSAETAALVHLREEEKLALDLYQALAASSGDRRFTNISRSEAQHFASMGALLEQFGVPDPAAGMPAGQFQSAELQALYDRLLTAGQGSAGAAIEQGITVERTDIADIDAALEHVDTPAIRDTLAQLRAGSERHLAAFDRG